MTLLNKRLTDPIYTTGLLCIIVSIVIFCLPLLLNLDNNSSFSFFTVNYLLFGVFFFARYFHRKKIEKENKIHHLILLLILFLISAYSLNRDIAIFEDSVNWFTCLLVLFCCNYMSFAFFEDMPRWPRHSVSFISGVGFVSFLYLAVYLFPLFVFGVLGSFLLGISLHLFVPALFTVYILVLQNRVAEISRTYWLSFSAGLLIAISFIVIYLLAWNHTAQDMRSTIREAGKDNSDLPAWVIVSQKIPRNSLAKKMLKAGIVYSVPGRGEFSFFGNMPGKRFGERRKHDPLVMIAVFFMPGPVLDDDNKIKVLESIYGMRQEKEDRLWNGDDLTTSLVNTNVKLWPRCSMAYTEKTITVAFAKENRGWQRQEEAIYTFYMPEGAVVSSLSLWIEGKEEKGVLTSKALADSAYRTIVGAERRDPSVVHWQEGNTVSVRVFPVVVGETRKFKLGITAPLERINGKLRYENIYFKGPESNEAKENIVVDFEQPVSDFKMPASFVAMQGNQSYQTKGNYIPEWSMEIKDPGLSDCSFGFEGNKYSLSSYHKKLVSAQVNDIYLDVNNAWTKDEYDKALALAKGKNVFVYTDSIINVNDSNSEILWKKLKKEQFSLFPLYEIDNTDQSLLITKSSGISPNLDELRGSRFLEKTKQVLTKKSRIKLFNVGDELTPYLKSLKEFRVFQYDNGDLDMLKSILQKSHFAEDVENDRLVIIHRSDMMIHKTPEETVSSGPDHLMRLFSYNHIMQKLGKDLLLDRPVQDSLVEEARKAYVVSPVSSLVVLETKKDYDRFDIKDMENSLKNASLKSKGAVPEPHEWVLIIVTLLTMLVITGRKRIQRNFQ